MHLDGRTCNAQQTPGIRLTFRSGANVEQPGMQWRAVGLSGPSGRC